jgi:hypothetical protein
MITLRERGGSAGPPFLAIAAAAAESADGPGIVPGGIQAR